MVRGRRLLLVMPANDRRAHVLTSLAAIGDQVDVVDSMEEAVRSMRTGLPDLVVLGEDRGESIPDVLAALRTLAPTVGVLLWPTDAEAGAALPEGSLLPSVLNEFEPNPAAPSPRTERRARGAPTRISLDPFVGESEEIHRLAAGARAALRSESPVLIEGETGTGKGVLAAWLHRNGPRAKQPFIDLNCAGFSRELMDSELFGHERGAFTGAITAKPGLLEVADGGTLFLDEIGDTDGPIQAKLLKVIEEKRFRRIGETRERHADVRIIAATHHDLSQLVREGRFREDLYYRIGVLSLRIPALRRRSADIGLLVQAIAGLIARDLGRPAPIVSDDASRKLAERDWPGNLRELRNTLERAMLAAGEQPIEPAHLGEETAASPQLPELPGGTLVDIERAYIERVLAEEQDVARAARRLGMARSTLYQKLQALGIKRRP